MASGGERSSPLPLELVEVRGVDAHAPERLRGGLEFVGEIDRHGAACHRRPVRGRGDSTARRRLPPARAWAQRGATPMVLPGRDMPPIGATVMPTRRNGAGSAACDCCAAGRGGRAGGLRRVLEPETWQRPIRFGEKESKESLLDLAAQMLAVNR